MANLYPFRFSLSLQALLSVLSRSWAAADTRCPRLHFRKATDFCQAQFFSLLPYNAFIRKTGYIRFALSLLICFPILSYGLPSQGSSTRSTSTIEPSGVGIFGNMSIQSDTLALWGDLVLENAQVQGAGVLTLIGTKPQHIVAHQSRVNQLALVNPNRVTLHGNLVIEKSLTVEQGLFDVQQAELTLGDSSKVFLLRNSKLLAQPHKLSYLPNKGATFRLLDRPFDAESFLIQTQWQRHWPLPKPAFINPVCSILTAFVAVRYPPPERCPTIHLLSNQGNGPRKS